jgi:hypothetical protein
MKRLSVVVAVCALLVPAVAAAKDPIAKIRVVFTPAPSGLKAGRVWQPRFRFFFPDGKPYRVSGARPRVVIRNGRTTKALPAAQVDSIYYAARIVFPHGGRWTVGFSFGPELGGGSRRLVTLRILP